jgi:hypothetical protein
MPEKFDKGGISLQDGLSIDTDPEDVKKHRQFSAVSDRLSGNNE